MKPNATKRLASVVARLLVVWLIVTWLSGCAAPSAIPIVERKQPPSERIMTHWVSSGETLYAIAWRYNMNVVDLARANGIAQPYTIRHGQKLSLDLSRLARRGSQSAATKKPSVVSHRSDPVAAKFDALSAWRWPLKGTLLKPFSWRGATAGNGGHKGIDIAGHRGQAVRAAKSGTVVYAGSGLPAYGKLLIVKHSDVYLSAYAHNSRLNVSEGERVKVGQKIAEVGSSGTNVNHLHFEIRKRGVPIDPASFLPKH